MIIVIYNSLVFIISLFSSALEINEKTFLIATQYNPMPVTIITLTFIFLSASLAC